jgi:hypothetical protein
MRRSVVALSVLVVGTVLALAAAGPAWAKTPPFGVQLSTTRPQPGETVSVTVRFWDDRRHTKPATWWDVPRIPHLLWAVPVDAQGNNDLEAAVPVTVRRGGFAEYRGTLTLTEPGSYVLVPFSVEGGFDAPAGYPKPIALDIAAAPSPAMSATSGSGGGPWLPIAIASALGAAVLGALVARRARRPRAPRPAA